MNKKNENIFGVIIAIAIVCVVLYFVGVSVIWGDSFSTVVKKLDLTVLKFVDEWWLFNYKKVVLTGETPWLLLGDHSMLVRINDSYYGFIWGARFFDAPFLQFLLLLIGLGCIGTCFSEIAGELIKEDKGEELTKEDSKEEPKERRTVDDSVGGGDTE